MTVMDREWTDKRMDDFAGRVDRFEVNVDKRFDRVDERFDKIDRRFDKIDERFGKVDERFERVDKRFDRLEAETRTGFANAAAEAKAASVKLDARMEVMTRTIWGGIIVAVVVKFLFG